MGKARGSPCGFVINVYSALTGCCPGCRASRVRTVCLPAVKGHKKAHLYSHIHNVKSEGMGTLVDLRVPGTQEGMSEGRPGSGETEMDLTLP